MSSSTVRRLALLGAGAAALTLVLSACSGEKVQNAVNTTNSTRGLKVVLNQSYGPDTRNKIDVYAPQNAQGAPTILFINGGSWQGGDKSGHAFVGESLARAGYVVGVMNYRLAPQNRYPSYVQDGAAALKWLRDHAGQFGGNPNNLFVSGHSAGGFNAVELVDNARWLAEVNVPVSSIRGVIGIAGAQGFGRLGDIVETGAHAVIDIVVGIVLGTDRLLQIRQISEDSFGRICRLCAVVRHFVHRISQSEEAVHTVRIFGSLHGP